jgi:IS30 family transposase
VVHDWKDLSASAIDRALTVPEVQSKTHGTARSGVATGYGPDKGRASTEHGAGRRAPLKPPMGGCEKVVPHGPKSGFLELQNKKQPGRPMEQAHSDRKRKVGKHFSWEERVRMETFDRALYPGKTRTNLSELARRLGRHRSSVSREYSKGTVMNKNSELEIFPVYSARKGQDTAEQAALNKGPRGKLTNQIAEVIRIQIVDEKLSPYAALVVLDKSGQHAWLPSERTVYYAIDNGLLNVARDQLPYKPKKKRSKSSGTRMAYTNARGRSITERPCEADERSEYGHWEMDTVVGGTGTSPACLLVMTERMTRQQLIRKIPNRTQEAVARALDRLEREPDSIFKSMKTITCDNGCEFLDTNSIERSVLSKRKRCEVFFAHPFSSFERGSNENANRIIRRFIPKGADISRFSKRQIQIIEDWINALPRKLFDGLTAQEKVELYFKEKVA